jgi:hypothetical protein
MFQRHPFNPKSTPDPRQRSEMKHWRHYFDPEPKLVGKVRTQHDGRFEHILTSRDIDLLQDQTATKQLVLCGFYVAGIHIANSKRLAGILSRRFRFKRDPAWIAFPSILLFIPITLYWSERRQDANPGWLARQKIAETALQAATTRKELVRLQEGQDDAEIARLRKRIQSSVDEDQGWIQSRIRELQADIGKNTSRSKASKLEESILELRDAMELQQRLMAEEDGQFQTQTYEMDTAFQDTGSATGRSIREQLSS